MVSTVIKKIKLFFGPKRRYIYAVTNGTYVGEWWVQIPPSSYFKQEDKPLKFFSLPDKFIREIPIKDFNLGITNKVIEPVDVLPEPIYNVCLAEYNHKATDEQLNNAISRRE
jgi:hypothetical protein